ncbi:hypothetical protein H4219_006319, partial [Mycoemilia scoparia]
MGEPGHSSRHSRSPERPGASLSSSGRYRSARRHNSRSRSPGRGSSVRYRDHRPSGSGRSTRRDQDHYHDRGSYSHHRSHHRYSRSRSPERRSSRHRRDYSRDEHKDRGSGRSQRRSNSRSRSPSSNSNRRHKRDDHDTREEGQRASSTRTKVDNKDHKGSGNRGSNDSQLLKTPKDNSHKDEEEEGLVQDDSEQALMELMGFGGFGTTKGQHVEGNAKGEASVKKERKYRQYMNRKGGFNRPLEGG